MSTCVICEGDGKAGNDDKGQFWALSNYYGWSGTFCRDCYDKVDHDCDGNPKHPEYTFTKLKYQ